MYPRRLHRQVVCNLDEPVVKTTAGLLRGLIADGTYIFRGVKYADAKRFHMPEPVAPWEGVRNALRFGNTCPELHTTVPLDENYVPHYYYPQDEDCQYLNIWTQSTDRDAKRPVLFWIHGGGYVSGSSQEIFSYDGENLSKYGDVVVVSINHRLNVLGFLDLSEYGDEYRYSGDLSIADMVAALRWVHENIESFGGDPDNVTIMGQSGGGFKVANLLQTPAADGLFHRAVIQSGMMDSKANRMPDEAHALTDKVLEILGITRENIKDIEKIPFYKLRRAAIQAEAEVPSTGALGAWAPTVNDYFLGNPLSELGFRKETIGIPVLIGSNLGEFSGNANYNPGDGAKTGWSENYQRKLIEDKYGDKADELIKRFRCAYPDNQTVDVMFLDTMFRKGVIAYARERAKAGGTVYSYMFKLEMPYLDGTLTWHNAEEAFMFHNAKHVWSSYIPGVTEKLQDIMATCWLRFAVTGDPNHGDIPEWHKVTGECESTMIFDRECKEVHDHDHSLMEILDNPWYFPDPEKEEFRPMAVGGGPRQSL